VPSSKLIVPVYKVEQIAYLSRVVADGARNPWNRISSGTTAGNLDADIAYGDNIAIATNVL